MRAPGGRSFELSYIYDSSTMPGRGSLQMMNASIDCFELEGQRAAWANRGDAVLSTPLTIVSELLAEVCDLESGERVLDVAAGHGNTTLAAARRGCEVVSTDRIRELLECGAERANAEGLSATFQVADLHALPFEDGAFDAVLSAFGAMVAYDHAQVASEMIRVCRPGGRIALASWTPNGFIGQMFEVLVRHGLMPVDRLLQSLPWGTMARLRTLFNRQVVTISATRHFFSFRYLSAAHLIATFRARYAPMREAFEALPEQEAAALERDLTHLLNHLKRPGTKTLVAPSEYLEVVITRH